MKLELVQVEKERGLVSPYPTQVILGQVSCVEHTAPGTLLHRYHLVTSTITKLVWEMA